VKQTEKNAEIVGWVGRVGAAGAEHVMARFDMGRSWAYARLGRLVTDGLLEQKTLLYRKPGLYVASAEGCGGAASRGSGLQGRPRRLPARPGGHHSRRRPVCGLYRFGVRPLAEILRDNPLAQDYVSWGAPGPGRWVTIYASASPTPHVFIVIAELRLDTSHDGTDVGPNRYENGPRWRILDHIPTWAQWSVRHPPGL
jgi:hypothetical protein